MPCKNVFCAYFVASSSHDFKYNVRDKDKKNCKRYESHKSVRVPSRHHSNSLIIYR